MKSHVAPVLLAASLAAGACAGSPEIRSAPTTPDTAQAAADVSHYFEGMDHLKRNALRHEGGGRYTIEVEIVPEALDMPPPQVTRTVLDAIVEIKGVVTEGKDKGWLTKGSGFLMADQASGNVELMTAGHVVANHDIDRLQITDNNGAPITYTGVDAYHKKSLYVESDSEDVAVIHPGHAQDLRGRALVPRDIQAERLKPGEELYFFNFQKRHEPGSPAVYAGLFAGDIDNTQFMTGLGDLLPGVEEDDARSGGSGGVVTDKLGRVAAILSNSDSTDNIPCGQSYYGYGRGVQMNGATVFVTLLPPNSIDECAGGLNEIHMRKINPGGTFKPVVPMEGASR